MGRGNVLAFSIVADIGLVVIESFQVINQQNPILCQPTIIFAKNADMSLRSFSQ